MTQTNLDDRHDIMLLQRIYRETVEVIRLPNDVLVVGGVAICRPDEDIVDVHRSCEG